MSEMSENTAAGSHSSEAQICFTLRIWLSTVIHHIPVLWVLVLATVVIHHLHWGDRLDAHLAGFAIAQFGPGEGLDEVLVEDHDEVLVEDHDEGGGRPEAYLVPPDAEEGKTKVNVLDKTKVNVLDKTKVNVLDISAVERIRTYETSLGHDAAYSDIQRAGGVRPINRATLVKLLLRLGDRLQALEPSQRPKVVVIDIDITPLDAAPQDSARDMHMALKRLRESSHVVATAWSRSDDESRQRRNMAMQTFDCSTTFPSNGSRGLFFASPIFFSVPGEYVTHILTFGKGRLSELGTTHRTEPFPSVGNVVARLLMGENDKAGKDLAGFTEFVVEMCNQAMVSHAAILEDCIQDPQYASSAQCSPQFSETHYQRQRLNWPLLFEADEIVSTSIGQPPDTSTDAEATDPLSIGDEWLSAQVLILAVDGGRGHDKFMGPDWQPEAITGATLHALAIATMMSGDSLDDALWLGMLADFGCGLLFLVLYFPGAQAITRWRTNAHPLPKLRAALAVAWPLILLAAIGWFVVVILGKGLMAVRMWTNPAYVLLGLLLHAYLEVSHASDGPHLVAKLAWPDFTFGLARCARTGLKFDDWVAPVIAAVTVIAACATSALGGYKWHAFVLLALAFVLPCFSLYLNRRNNQCAHA